MTRAGSRFAALPAYIGGKRRLAPRIFRELDRVVPRPQWSEMTFLDGFLGGGAVSLYAKAMGFRVHAVDVAARSAIVGEALIANGHERLTRADVLRVLAHDPATTPVSDRYVPRVFPASLARFLDQALDVARTARTPARGALLRLLAMKTAMAAHPMAQVRPGTAHRMATGEYEAITESCVSIYVDAATLTHPDRLWRTAQAINRGVSPGTGTVDRADIRSILPVVAADIAYFDPPYPGTTAYEREYKILDEILEGEARPISGFSKSGGTTLLDDLFAAAGHIPLWVVSFGNAETSLEELEAMMARHGRLTRAVAIRYAHKASVARAEHRDANREYLVLGVDPASPWAESLTTPSTATTEEAADAAHGA